MNNENLELPDLHAKLSGHTRDSALISAFQTLKRFEDNLVEQCDSGKPFTNTEPYQVKFEDGVCTVFGWGGTTGSGKYGIRVNYDD